MEVDRTLSIGAQDVVLDVGSGHLPHPSAAVLVDRFPDDPSQRLGLDIVRDRAFIAADVERLPFRDKAFDYVIASHVLEHTADPIAAAAELSRVGRRGYVEMPTEIWELLFGWEFHTYAATLASDGTIVFKRKSRPQPPLGELFYRVSDHDPTFGEVILSHPELFYVSVEWDDHIPCRLDATPWPESLDASDYVARIRTVRPSPQLALRTFARMAVARSVRRLVRRLAPAGPARPARRRAPAVDLADVMACPACRSSALRWGTDAIDCIDCRRSFEINQGVPVMLLRDAVPHGSP